MDPEERQELKENDLAEFFRSFGEWWSRHGNTVLIALIVIAGGITVYNFYTSRVAQRHEQAWTDLAVATSPEGHAQVAETHDDPVVRALGNLRGADLYRRRALGRYEPPEQTAAAAGLSEQSAIDESAGDDEAQPDPTEDLSQAAALYRRVLEQDPAAVPTVYRVNALLGLGAVAESEKRWDDAREHYEQAAEQAGEQLPQLAAQARERTDLLDELRRPIVFAPEGAGPSPQSGAMPPGVTPGPASGAQNGATPNLNIDLPGNVEGGDADADDTTAGEDDAATDGDAASDSAPTESATDSP